jgi:hypothetical protein
MEFPTLAGFLTGCFHQDWDVEFASVSEVATHYGSTDPIEYVFRVVGEGAVLLARFNESEVESYLISAGCEYIKWGATSEWLRDMLSDIVAAAALRP